MMGIIGSLIFVDLEMRLSQRLAQPGQQQDRTASFVGLLGANREAGADWREENGDIAKLTQFLS